MGEGGIVNSCDFRRLVLPTWDLNQCRDANEEGVSPYPGGCNPEKAPERNKPLVEDDAKCWEVQNFGEPDDGNDNENDNDENEGDGDDDDDDDDEKSEDDGDNNDEEEEEEQENDSGDGSQDEGDDEEDDNGNSNDSGDVEEDSDDNDTTTCKDDPSFLFRNKPNKPCTKMKAKQCGKKQNGKEVSKLCPFTCDTCPDDADEKSEDDGDNNDEEEENEESSASADGDDDDDDDNICKDDPLFRFRKNGRKTNKTCDKMNSKKCKKKQGGKKIHKYCPMTCGKC